MTLKITARSLLPLHLRSTAPSRDGDRDGAGEDAGAVALSAGTAGPCRQPHSCAAAGGRAGMRTAPRLSVQPAQLTAATSALQWAVNYAGCWAEARRGRLPTAAEGARLHGGHSVLTICSAPAASDRRRRRRCSGYQAAAVLSRRHQSLCQTSQPQRHAKLHGSGQKFSQTRLKVLPHTTTGSSSRT